jgi:multidrug efflux system outer membrane protein
MNLSEPGYGRIPLKLVLPVILMLSGCAKPIPYESPNMPLTDKYSVVMPVRGDGYEKWWTSFRDPTLDHLIDQALSDNLSLAEAEWRIKEAQSNLRRAGSSVSGNAEIEAAGTSAGSEAGSVELTALVDIFGRRAARVSAAKARLEAERLGQLDTRRRLLLELGSAYVDLRFFQESLNERKGDLGSRQTTLREITKQREAGAATELDVVRAKALVAEIEVDIPQLGANIIEQRNRITTLVGKPAGDLGVGLAYSGTQPHPKGVAEIGVPADLLRQRPDIRQAERLYAAAVSDMAEANANRYPSLSLSGLVRAPFDGSGGSESLTAGLIIPVFSQGALEAEEKAAAARANQAYLQWRSAVLSAVEEVETALASLRGSLNAVGAARRVVSLNEESLNLTRTLLENRGDITVLDLLDRERTVTNSRTTLAGIQRSVALDFITLRAALGEGSAVRIVQ